MNKSSYSKKKKKKGQRQNFPKKKKNSILSKSFKKRKKEKEEGNFWKKALGLGALGLYFLGCFPKIKRINQNFQFFEKIQDFQNFQ